MSGINVGDQIPAFEMPVTGGGMITNADLAGQIWVLYFYPKDDTPGCTKEAIGFTEELAAFDAAGATVIGVSKDTITKHEKFVAKHDLGIRLAADDSDFCEKIGVWVEKKMYGKTYMGIERATFLVGADGSALQVWRKVKVPGHVEDVLQAVRAQA